MQVMGQKIVAHSWNVLFTCVIKAIAFKNVPPKTSNIHLTADN